MQIFLINQLKINYMEQNSTTMETTIQKRQLKNIINLKNAFSILFLFFLEKYIIIKNNEKHKHTIFNVKANTFI